MTLNIHLSLVLVVFMRLFMTDYFEDVDDNDVLTDPTSITHATIIRN